MPPHYQKHEISISLINFHQKHDLQKLLPSLIPAADKVDAEILLVDNSPDDGTSSFLRQMYGSRIDSLTNHKRTGYGGNHNLNLLRAQGRHFVIMNSDMEVNDSELFVWLKGYLDEFPDVGMVTPKILNPDETIQYLNKRYVNIFDLISRRIPLKTHLTQNRLERFLMKDVGYDDPYDVEFMSGAFMYCRTDVLRSVGGFDERYFLYFEDADLTRKVQQSHRTVYRPEVSIIHHWHRSSIKNWKFTMYLIQSGVRYFNKWGYKLV